MDNIVSTLKELTQSLEDCAEDGSLEAVMDEARKRRSSNHRSSPTPRRSSNAPASSLAANHRTPPTARSHPNPSRSNYYNSENGAHDDGDQSYEYRPSPPPPAPVRTPATATHRASATTTPLSASSRAGRYYDYSSSYNPRPDDGREHSSSPLQPRSYRGYDDVENEEPVLRSSSYGYRDDDAGDEEPFSNHHHEEDYCDDDDSYYNRGDDAVNANGYYNGYTDETDATYSKSPLPSSGVDDVSTYPSQPYRSSRSTSPYRGVGSDSRVRSSLRFEDDNQYRRRQDGATSSNPRPTTMSEENTPRKQQQADMDYNRSRRSSRSPIPKSSSSINNNEQQQHQPPAAEAAAWKDLVDSMQDIMDRQEDMIANLQREKEELKRQLVTLMRKQQQPSRDEEHDEATTTRTTTRTSSLPAPKSYYSKQRRPRQDQRHQRQPLQQQQQQQPIDRTQQQQSFGGVFSPGTEFVGELSQVMPLAPGYHASLAVILDKHWDRVAEIRKRHEWENSSSGVIDTDQRR